MKLTYKQIEPFVKNPNPAARIVLVYGPDQGLMHERTTVICKTIVNDLNDPFNVAQFTTDKIIEDPAAFYDETQAQSMMGGQRLIIIKQGEDKLSPVLKEYLEKPSLDTLVVIEAGDLTTRSALRKLCETAKNAAAVPCYVDDERSLAQIIRDMCGAEGYRIDQDALISLSSSLIGDRTIARNEIEKILLYKGLGGNESERKNRGTISINDIMANYGDVKDWGFDRLVYAVANGQIVDTQSIIDSLLKDNTAPIAMMRSVQNHFWRLFMVQSKMKDGLNMEAAVKTLSPPLFWKVADAFKGQLRKWPLSALEAAIDSLNTMESRMKQSDYNDISIMTNGLIQLARYNPRRMAG